MEKYELKDNSGFVIYDQITNEWLYSYPWEGCSWGGDCEDAIIFKTMKEAEVATKHLTSMFRNQDPDAPILWKIYYISTWLYVEKSKVLGDCKKTIQVNPKKGK